MKPRVEWGGERLRTPPTPPSLTAALIGIRHCRGLETNTDSTAISAVASTTSTTIARQRPHAPASMSGLSCFSASAATLPKQSVTEGRVERLAPAVVERCYTASEAQLHSPLATALLRQRQHSRILSQRYNPTPTSTYWRCLRHTDVSIEPSHKWQVELELWSIKEVHDPMTICYWPAVWL